MLFLWVFDLIEIEPLHVLYTHKQTSTSLPWDLPDDRTSHLTPPPQKRIKSVDLYRAQHGLSPDRENSSLKDVQPLLAAAAAHHLRSGDRSRDRVRMKDHSRSSRDSSTQERDRSTELRDSLLGQALESGINESVLFFVPICIFLISILILKRKIS